jgi:hypothetical protein
MSINQIDHLFMIYQEVKNNLGYFLKLFRLGKKEGLTPENIISLHNTDDNLLIDVISCNINRYLSFLSEFNSIA